eukprot:gnl/MRDRNA2_/MRDRNA2_79137_c0_seq2.p1 gnl/MRDRNA2_/MRDRNA2_79137_c0~~gnl/MRDRNA2_/MRDRNA2_79137_c0_seq2.p1  ORF type:complete len:171 (+),score=19.91 gnl/MRDRNA2_/MRDRNA2_79137_c0_seq2:53-565(+)
MTSSSRGHIFDQVFYYGWRGVYLNNVLEGGETHFEHLNVSIRPTAGTALLFFPAFANGSPDMRTLHAAIDAISVKWIAQQWIVGGWSEDPMSQVAHEKVKTRQIRFKAKIDKLLSDASDDMNRMDESDKATLIAQLCDEWHAAFQSRMTDEQMEKNMEQIMRKNFHPAGI